jgi:hypothetical protein
MTNGEPISDVPRLGIAEIAFAGGDIVRHLIQLIRHAMQQLFHVLLNGHFR